MEGKQRESESHIDKRLVTDGALHTVTTKAYDTFVVGRSKATRNQSPLAGVCGGSRLRTESTLRGGLIFAPHLIELANQGPNGESVCTFVVVAHLGLSGNRSKVTH